MHVITPTLKCNSNCIMCSVDGNINKNSSFQEILKRIDEINPKEDLVIIDGGEPTLDKNLFKILKMINRKAYLAKIQLLSNGRTFKYLDYCRELSKQKLINFELHIPLSGSNETIHDKITQTEGSFEQTIKGIENLLELEFNIEIITVVNKMNYKNLKELSTLISNRFQNIKKWRLFSMILTGNAVKNFDNLFIRFSDVAPYLYDAIDVSGVDIDLLHFPLCVLRREYWEFISGSGHVDFEKERRVRDKNKVCFPLKECKECKVYLRCGGVWSSYVKFAGTDEFNIIK